MTSLTDAAADPVDGAVLLAAHVTDPAVVDELPPAEHTILEALAV